MVDQYEDPYPAHEIKKGDLQTFYNNTNASEYMQ